jgi:hypothetical protein
MIKNEISYGVLCEDSAHLTFINGFLLNYTRNNDIELLFNDNFFYRFKASNSKEVLKKYVEAAILGFRDYNLDFLIIGIDYDDRNRKKFNEEIEKLYSNLYIDFRKKSIIMFPVQAIEHWLLYIKYHIENPKSTKNIAFEHISRKDAKEKIYQNKLSKINRINIVKYLLNSLNVEWLKNHSESFNRFNSDFINTIQKIIK